MYRQIDKRIFENIKVAENEQYGENPIPLSPKSWFPNLGIPFTPKSEILQALLSVFQL